jgi:hypothetical protein
MGVVIGICIKYKIPRGSNSNDGDWYYSRYKFITIIVSLLKRLRNGRFASCVEVLELTLHSNIYLVMGVRDSKGEAGEP